MTRRLVLDYPLRPGNTAQVAVPQDMTSAEAARLCAFIRTLAQPDAPPAARRPETSVTGLRCAGCGKDVKSLPCACGCDTCCSYTE